MSENQSLLEKLGITPEEFTEIGRIGGIYYKQGNLKKAKAIFEGLIELNPNSHETHSALGALLVQAEDYQNATFHLDKAIELDANKIAPFVNRAEIRIKQLNLVGAIADLKHAIELDPLKKDVDAHRARTIVLGIYETFQVKGFIKPRNG
jgi:tetratricopeptide (TPR) repeat protein